MLYVRDIHGLYLPAYFVYMGVSCGLLTRVDDDAMRAPPPFYMSSFGSCVDLPRPALIRRLSRDVYNVRRALSDEAASERVVRQSSRLRKNRCNIRPGMNRVMRPSLMGSRLMA
jgi:hypothetical protein